MSATTTTMPLNDEEISNITGAAGHIPFPYPKDLSPVEPPVYVTQAIGEDGGEIPYDIY
ncbi:hypothetical protein [Alteromonas sp. CYL-A6]|uniref:hypothetical protein n=1 Tax=Alteromonas nitratireducens TaxID=3390813 RepID=UPI0034BEC4E0